MREFLLLPSASSFNTSCGNSRHDGFSFAAARNKSSTSSKGSPGMLGLPFSLCPFPIPSVMAPRRVGARTTIFAKLVEKGHNLLTKGRSLETNWKLQRDLLAIEEWEIWREVFSASRMMSSS